MNVLRELGAHRNQRPLSDVQKATFPISDHSNLFYASLKSFYYGHSLLWPSELVIANTSSSNTRENSTHGHHQMVNIEIRLIIFFAAKDGQALYWQQKQDCGSDHELLITKFRLKLKKVGKTTRPFRYDLNQIPYDYTVEVRNRF